MKKILVLVVLSLFAFGSMACNKAADKADPAKAGEAKKEEPKKDEAKKEEPKAEPAKEEPKAEPPKEEPKPAEPPKEEPKPAAAAGSPCDAYAACCTGYVDALGKVEGVQPAMLDGAKQGCAQIEQFKTMGDAAAQACTQALSALKQGMEGMKAMPGFVVPDACK